MCVGYLCHGSMNACWASCLMYNFIYWYEVCHFFLTVRCRDPMLFILVPLYEVGFMLGSGIIMFFRGMPFRIFKVFTER